MKTLDKNIKYSVIKLNNGMFRPQREYGERTMYPAFDSLRDANIFMEYMTDDYKPGIVGNVRIINESEA